MTSNYSHPPINESDATQRLRFATNVCRWRDHPDIDKVFVAFVERSYALPPSDAPVIVSSDVSDQHYTTLALCAYKKSNLAKDTIKKNGGLGCLEKQWDCFLFQESEKAPAASAHPPPENDDDPKLRPLYRTFNVARTCKVGSIDAILKDLGGLQRRDLPMWVRPPKDGEDVFADSAEERPKKVLRTEKTTEEAKQQACAGSSSGSQHPAIPAIEHRIDRLGALSDKTLDTLLLLRDSLSKNGCHEAPSREEQLMTLAARDAYHTVRYRKGVYQLVESGAITIGGKDDGEATSFAKKEHNGATERLPWDRNGNIH